MTSKRITGDGNTEIVVPFERIHMHPHPYVDSEDFEATQNAQFLVYKSTMCTT